MLMQEKQQYLKNRYNSMLENGIVMEALVVLIESDNV